MKTSNLIVLIGAAMLFVMSLFFQGRVHYHVKQERVAGYGATETQSRAIARFDRIQVGENIKVVFSQDSITTLNVQGPREVLDSIKTTVLQNELRISLESRRKTKDTIKVFVNNDNLSELVLTGGYFENKGMLRTEKFYLKMDKDSDCTLNLNAEILEVDLAKGAGLDLKGKTEQIIFINQ